jgi:3',5'-cyclic AMP phosphodiesterase CpdA
LSDLHLGKDDPWERRTDDKVGLTPSDESSRLSVLETALTSVREHIAAKGQFEELDAVVVSGDCTSGYDPAGFTRFRELLQKADLVPNERVVVVPGNHDVDWTADPGAPQNPTEKYKLFLENTRNIGMRTPLCDGVDTEGYAAANPTAQPVLWLDDAVIVSLNTANWCGVRASSDTARARKAAPPKTYDVARVSEWQLDLLTDALRERPTRNLVRIAVLHHHLLPVSEDEEVKEFESFTNLARLRGWLRRHQFQVVLHGHKHRPVLTWDDIFDLDDFDAPPAHVAVVSGPRPSSWGEPVCRLIRTGAATGRKPVAGAPRMIVDTSNAQRHEHLLDPDAIVVPLDPGERYEPTSLSIEADTADAVYERLLDTLGDGSDKLLNVTCVVRNAKSAEKPPTNFTKVNLPEQWLKDVVDWWQKASPSLVATGDAPFNHGERLYGTGTQVGALDVAAGKLGSTTAMALLISDAELRAAKASPTFVAVQLVKANDAQGSRLDCVGYFRKQDMTLWWPVNVAELRAIQQYVLDLDKAEGVRAGRLVTFAAEAIRDDVLPKLEGTIVDRSVDLRPDVLMTMAYQAAHGDVAEPDDIAKLWKDVLGDIGAGGDFPSLGITRLSEHLKVFREVGALTHLDVLIKRLEAVYDRAYRARTTANTKSERQEFSATLFKLVSEVLEAVNDAVEVARSNT